MPLTADPISQNSALPVTPDESLKVKLNTIQDYRGPVCFFASYCYSGNVDDYVYYYLQAIQKAGYAIVFITTSPVGKACTDKLAAICHVVLERKNEGLDFGSWRAALQFLNWGQQFQSVLLANDSVFGPFHDLGQIITSMNKRYDCWGMTDNYESGHHIQSYFLHFNKKVISSALWAGFWREMDTTLSKGEIIQQYEVGFSAKLVNAQFKTGVYAPIDVLVKSVDDPFVSLNSSLAYWQPLIEKFDFPFLKREILINPTLNRLYWDKLSLYINQNSWRKTVQKTAYPIALIDSFLQNYFHVLQGKNKNVKIRKSKFLFLAHNVDLGGAQKVLLNFIKWFKENTDIPFEILVMYPGASDQMLDAYIDLGQVTFFSGLSEEERKDLQKRLAGEYVGLIFSNTIVNVDLQKFLSFLKTPQITYVHELPFVMSHFPQVGLNRQWLKTNITKFIACANVVKENLVIYLDLPEEKIDVVYGFVEDIPEKNPDSLNHSLLETLKIPEKAFVVGMSGTFEWRKSADLLPIIASMLCAGNTDIHILWVGADEKLDLFKNICSDLEKAGLLDRVHFVPKQENPYPYYNLFHIFLMLSREDPFPLVNIENGLLGTPVICFDKTGGSPEYTGLGLGNTVPYLDFSGLKEAVSRYYHSSSEEGEKERIREITKSNFITGVQAPKLSGILSAYFEEAVMIPVVEPDITVMTHIYYDNTWVDIKRKLKQFDNRSTFFLFSISEDCLIKEEIVADIRGSFDNAFTLTTSNLGKDIGGKFALIDLYLTLEIDSEFIIFLHDKQSPQTLVGEAWKNNLHKIIDKKNYPKIVELFTQNMNIGLVGAKEHIINEYDHQKKTFIHNNELANEFLKKYQIKITNYEYLSGTMYWLRASIIKEFFTKNNPVELRSELEAGNVLDNGGSTVAHTWERMICWITSNQGFKIHGI